MVKPLGDRVIIQVPKNEKKVSPGGIILTESVNEKKKESTLFGTVISVSKGVVEVKEGDVVLIDKYSGTLFTVENDDNKYIIIRVDDILGVD